MSSAFVIFFAMLQTNRELQNINKYQKENAR